MQARTDDVADPELATGPPVGAVDIQDQVFADVELEPGVDPPGVVLGRAATGAAIGIERISEEAERAVEHVGYRNDISVGTAAGRQALLRQKGRNGRVGRRRGESVTESRTLRALGGREGRRIVDAFQIGLGPQCTRVPAGGIAQVGVGLRVCLVPVFLFGDVVEGNVGEAADRRGEIAAEFGTALVRRGDRVEPASTKIGHGEQARCRQGGIARCVHVVGQAGVVARGRRQFRTMLPAGTDEQVEPAEVLADQAADIEVVVRALHEGPVASDFDAVEIVAGDEVGHAGDRVRPVGCRGTVLQDFDALQGKERDQVGVGKAVTRRLDRALAVQQDEGAGETKAAQVDRAVTLEALRCGGELVGIAQNRTDRRQFLDQFERRGDALLGQLLGRYGVHRQRRVFRRAADQRPGNDDGFGCRLLVAVTRFVDLCEGGRCGGRSGKSDQGATVAPAKFPHDVLLSTRISRRIPVARNWTIIFVSCQANPRKIQSKPAPPVAFLRNRSLTGRPCFSSPETTVSSPICSAQNIGPPV